MKSYILMIILTIFGLNAFAQDIGQCDGPLPIDRISISTDEEDVNALICQSGNEVVILPERPVKKEHLVYAGLNLGLPYMGLSVTYAQNKNGKPFLHVTSALEGSLGSNGIKLEAGKHPFHNALFAGGTVRGYKGLPGEKGLEIGPTIGLAGTRSRFTGQVSLSYMTGYNTRMGSMTKNLEFSVGLRMRLLRSR